MRIVEGFGIQDFPRLLEIKNTCFGEAKWCPSDQNFVQVLMMSRVWLAKEDDRIVGLIIVNHDFPRAGHADTKPGEAQILTVAVLPQQRNRGIGRKLLEEAESWCRSQGDYRIKLVCHPDNPSQKLYFDLGYRHCDIIRPYYGGIGLVMKKELAVRPISFSPIQGFQNVENVGCLGLTSQG